MFATLTDRTRCHYVVTFNCLILAPGPIIPHPCASFLFLVSKNVYNTLFPAKLEIFQLWLATLCNHLHASFSKISPNRHWSNDREMNCWKALLIFYIGLHLCRPWPLQKTKLDAKTISQRTRNKQRVSELFYVINNDFIWISLIYLMLFFVGYQCWLERWTWCKRGAGKKKLARLNLDQLSYDWSPSPLALRKVSKLRFQGLRVPMVHGLQ